MSSDYKNNKNTPYSTYPQRATTQGTDGKPTGFTRVEPWIDPQRLRDEFLFGIPLVSPQTKQQMSDGTIKNIIRRAAANVELKCKIDVFPVQRVFRDAFERVKLTQGFNQLQLPNGNVQSIQEIAIRATNTTSTPNFDVSIDSEAQGSLLYSLPLSWIDMNQINKGIIHFVPLSVGTTSSLTGVSGVSSGAATPLLMALQNLPYVPAFWCITYTSGFSENSIPEPINELIACYACMEVLGLLGPLNKYNSQSISIDASSQSTSGPGNQLYVVRYQQLQEKAKNLEDLIMKRFTKRIFMTNF
jgi:hypothetical protein